MEIKNKPVIIGDYTWEETRDFLIIQLKNCNTLDQFVKIIGSLTSSIGTLKEIKRVRKRMGIKPLTKMEEKKLKNETKRRKKSI